MSNIPSAGQTYIFSWVIQNLVICDQNNFVDLNEIKKKFTSPVKSSVIGNQIKTVFEDHVKIKSGRCKDDWTKSTQRYYGITWKSDTNQFTFDHLTSSLPADYFIIKQSPTSVKVGHFNGEVINGNKILCEIEFKSDGNWSLFVKGKTVNLDNIGVDCKFTNCEDVFQTINLLKFCKGVNEVSSTSQVDLNSFREHVSEVGDENSETIRYRAKKCNFVLSFKTSNNTSLTCSYCKKLHNVPARKGGDMNTLNNESQVITNVQAPNITVSENDNDVILCEKDHADLSNIFELIFPECSLNMKSFLMSQKMALERHPFGRRWSKDIIRVCLTLWCRSPRGYTELRNSNFMILPSQKLLQKYKNCVHQEAGISKEMLHWMANEAKSKNIPPEGYEGGLIIDEMSIQPDLQFKMKNGNIELIGFTECTPESIVFDQIHKNSKERPLATHVLQLVFLGFTGFRFPFAHFPTTTASGQELYLVFWKAVNFLAMFGFKVQYISTDGAQSNRDLFKILLPNVVSSSPYTCSFTNIYSKDNPKMFFIMDYSHVVKKIRNNILKSGTGSFCKRHLKVGDKFIEWDHFKMAYLWDISSNPFPVHHKLTQEHMYVTSEGKMRNHLAEDVLDSQMLHLMEEYKNSLGEVGVKLEATIQLLKCTSVLIKNFRDCRPITDSADDRLQENFDAMQWFINWEKAIREDPTIKQKERHLISHQTREDIVSSILGFHELCHYKFKRSHASIIPSRMNSDVVENMFCQQRTLHNGANTNPTYLGYCHAVNAVILGQVSVSRKSNAGCGESAQLCQRSNILKTTQLQMGTKWVPMQKITCSL